MRCAAAWCGAQQGAPGCNRFGVNALYPNGKEETTAAANHERKSLGIGAGEEDGQTKHAVGLGEGDGSGTGAEYLARYSVST